VPEDHLATDRVSAGHQSIAVVLDLVDPIGSGWRPVGEGWEAGLYEAGGD